MTNSGLIRGATEEIARFATKPRTQSEGRRNGEQVAITVLDTLGVAMAGIGTEAPQILKDWVTSLSSFGQVPVWGTDVRVSAPDAALINGTAAHALDWDDAVPSMPIHPGTVLVPALLAQAEVQDVSGAALVEAYNIGTAVFRAVSEALPVNASVSKGWHNTATSGRLAVVAALANLVKLDVTQTGHALGIVASTTSGSVANFGTMTKPLHAGLAARDGLMAVSLAARGFTSAQNQLEGRNGFFDMHRGDQAPMLDGLPERLDYWHDNWVSDWSLKRYPCCYGTHHAIDAALAVRTGVDLDQIAQIDVSIYAPDLGILTEGRPSTGLEAKFSVEYVVAVALLRGQVTLADFTSQTVEDPEVDRLRERVKLRGDVQATSRFAEITLTLRDGGTLFHRVDLTRGDARNPMTSQEVREKYLQACIATSTFSVDSANRAAEAVLTLPNHPSLQALMGDLAHQRHSPDPQTFQERNTP